MLFNDTTLLVFYFLLIFGIVIVLYALLRIVQLERVLLRMEETQVSTEDKIMALEKKLVKMEDAELRNEKKLVDMDKRIMKKLK